MKRKKISILKLNKKSISNLQNNLSGGYNAQTCEGPCQGGTTCCSEGGQACDDGTGDDPIRLPNTTFRTILSCKIC